MGLQVTAEELARWERLGLIEPAPQTPAMPPASGFPENRNRAKPQFVTAAFDPAGPTWTVPLATSNPLNGGRTRNALVAKKAPEWWAVRKAVGRHVGSLALAADDLARGLIVGVRLVRLGGQKMDDDGIPSAMKYVRDAVAFLVGVDDGHPCWRWRYDQEPGGPVGVRIELSSPGA